MRHAIIDKDNVVINVIIWDGNNWTPPVDCIVIKDDMVNRGDIYNPDTNTFSTPLNKEDS